MAAAWNLRRHLKFAMLGVSLLLGPNSFSRERGGQPLIEGAAAPNAKQAMRLDLVDPELLPLLQSLPARGAVRTAETMPSVREGFLRFVDLVRSKQGPMPLGVSVKQVHIEGAEGAPSLRALVYSPQGAEKGRPALLDIHGGSWILGAPEMNDFRNARLSHDLGMVVVSIDYRLAPEHPYPAALDDAYAALAWLNQNAASLGIDPSKIAISGDSAGGSIAAGLVLRTRDEKKYMPAFQVLIYPAVGEKGARGSSDVTPAAVDRNAAFAVQSYLGSLTKIDREYPAYAVPANAETFAGFPPTFLAVGAIDPLALQDMAFAGRLLESGVPTELHVYPGAFHGFDMASEAIVTKRFYDDLRNAYARALKIEL